MKLCENILLQIIGDLDEPIVCCRPAVGADSLEAGTGTPAWSEALEAGPGTLVGAGSLEPGTLVETEAPEAGLKLFFV
jgi:hypothetical protein